MGHSCLRAAGSLRDRERDLLRDAALLLHRPGRVLARSATARGSTTARSTASISKPTDSRSRPTPTRNTPLFLFPQGHLLEIDDDAGHIVLEGLELRNLCHGAAPARGRPPRHRARLPGARRPLPHPGAGRRPRPDFRRRLDRGGVPGWIALQLCQVAGVRAAGPPVPGLGHPPGRRRRPRRDRQLLDLRRVRRGPRARVLQPPPRQRLRRPRRRAAPRLGRLEHRVPPQPGPGRARRPLMERLGQPAARPGRDGCILTTT